MGIRQFKPVSKASRFRSVSDFAEITRTHAREVAGRADQEVGWPRQPRPHLDASHRRWTQAHVPPDRFQAEQARRCRPIVKEIEYDPNRSARIALVEYADGEKRYILHPKGLKQGDTVVSGPGADVRLGNAMPLKEVPLGTVGAQHRAEDRQGRPDGALGRHVRAGRGEGRRVRDAAPGAAAKCAWCTATASRRSAKSATRSTSCSRTARRARAAGWASVRRCVVKS